jgi:pyrroline-5-carboxylate reductase
VQASCTAILGSESTDPKFVDAAELLFGCVGTVVRLAEESAMHGFTGAVGSGIAYGFVFAEALADACVAEGLSRPVSRRAAASVLRGAAELLLDDESVNPAERKDAVCSPGGTTIEGVAKLEELGFRSAVIQAVRTAARRSRSLQGDDDE